MFDSGPDDHLSRISTVWTMIFQSHEQDSKAVKAAQSAVMERYSGAVYRYLLRVLRSADAADEVFQQFALSFVRGGFRHANPDRGRFRDYLKISLLRFVSDHRRRHMDGRGKSLLSSKEVASDENSASKEWDLAFAASMRDELLGRAWQGLLDFQQETGRPLHDVLEYRSRLPNAAASEMATELTKRLQPEEPFSDAGMRKTLQRAREKFSDILLDEVARSLATPERSVVEQEVIDLGLHAYCASALKRRFG